MKEEEASSTCRVKVDRREEENKKKKKKRYDKLGDEGRREGRLKRGHTRRFPKNELCLF